MSTKTNIPQKIINRDGGRPTCPHCGAMENKTISRDTNTYECVKCGKIFQTAELSRKL